MCEKGYIDLGLMAEQVYSMKPKTIIVAVSVVAIVIVAGVAAILMTSDDDTSVRYVVVTPTLMGDWLENGNGDAFIAWEPFVSSATVGGYGTVLNWTSEFMPNHPCCVVAVSNEFRSSEMGENLTLRFLKAHVEATNWILDALEDPDSDEYDLLVAMSVSFTLRDEAVVAQALEHVKFGYEMDSEFVDALEQFTEMYIESGVVENATVTDLGYDGVSDFIADYVDESYLSGLSAVVPSDTILNPDDPIRLGYLAGDIHQLAQYVAANRSVMGSKSLFEAYGLNVEAATGAPYGNGGDEMNAFIAGHVDIGYLGAPPAILKRLNAAAETVIISQVNSEGSAIVVPVGSDIGCLEDMSGKLVATPGEASIQHLLLKNALMERGLRLAVA